MVVQVLGMNADCCYLLITAAWRDPAWALGIAMVQIK